MRRNVDYPSYYYKDIEGTAEIGLERSAGEPFRELKVYGESVQGGENLFDANEWFPNYANDSSGITYTNNEARDIYRIHVLEGQFEENIQYIFSCDYEMTNNSDTNVGVFLRMCANDDTIITQSRFTCYANETVSGSISITNQDKSTISYVVISYTVKDYNYSVKLSNMRIYKAPSPDNPIKVESVGEKTAQLFNLPTSGEVSWYANSSGLAPKGVRNPDGSITFDGTNRDNVVKNMHKTFGDSEKMIIEETGVYAFSCKNASSAIYMSCRLPNGSGGFAYQTIATSSKIMYVTIEQGTEITVYIQVAKNASVSNLTLYPMMQKVNAEGDAVADYEPYGYKADIEVMNGTRIDIPASNLFALNNIAIESSGYDWIIARISDTAANDTPGSGYSSSGRLQLRSAYVSKGKYYRACYDIEYLDVIAGEFTFPVQHWSLSGSDRINIEGLNKVYHVDTTECYDESYNALYFSLNSCRVKISNFRLYESDEEIIPTTSTIYLKEPLRKIGDYADEIDVIDEKVTRNILEYVFTGEETWVNPHGGLDTTIRSYARHIIMPRIHKDCVWVGFSEKGIFDGISTSSGDAERCQFSNYADTYSAFYVRILKSRCADPENPAKSDFTNIYTPGTKVYGVRETPIEEPILLSDEIKTLKRNCQLRVKTSLSPSKVKAQYYRY